MFTISLVLFQSNFFFYSKTQTSAAISQGDKPKMLHM
jgi:hypothetical protein